MPTYVALSRLTPESVKIPADLKRLEKAETAAQVLMIMRSFGHAHIETWTAGVGGPG